MAVPKCDSNSEGPIPGLLFYFYFKGEEMKIRIKLNEKDLLRVGDWVHISKYGYTKVLGIRVPGLGGKRTKIVYSIFLPEYKDKKSQIMFHLLTFSKWQEIAMDMVPITYGMSTMVDLRKVEFEEVMRDVGAFHKFQLYEDKYRKAKARK